MMPIRLLPVLNTAFKCSRSEIQHQQAALLEAVESLRSQS
jgi:hypothetical protein